MSAGLAPAARKALTRIAAIYAAVTAPLLAVNVLTRGPTWWYFAAGGVAVAIGMHAMRMRRVRMRELP